MSQANDTSHTTWVGASRTVTVEAPSWLAPPLPKSSLDPSRPGRPPLRVSVPPPEAARLYPSLRPPVEARALEARPAAVAPEPAPPPYPDLRAEYAALQAELSATADCISQLRRQILDSSEEPLVRLACAVGERIAGRELTLDPELVVGWTREAIAQLAKDESVVVAVSLDIAAALHEAAWEPVVSASVRIETDAALGKQCCEVRGRQSTVDVSLARRAEMVTADVAGPVK